MGMNNCDFMPLIVWIVHFAWVHEAEIWFGGIHVWRYSAITSVKTGLCCCETCLWNLGLPPPFIVSMETIQLSFLIRGLFCSSGGVSAVTSDRLMLKLLGSNWRGGLWSPPHDLGLVTVEVRSLWGDAKRNRLKNLNVDAKRDTWAE